jgi:sulfhydrogenase subunit gamma (sulfur reductase)
MERLVIENSYYMVRQARILRVEQTGETEKLFQLALSSGQSLDHEPGQFIMVSLLGIGESPISIASAPNGKESFDLCVRAAGKVTTYLHTLREGDEISIRGPYGNGFPLRVLRGNDLLVIAGGLGIAPLRSLINYVIDNRRDFGKMHILLGCKSPQDMLFKNDVERWIQRSDVHFACTIDRAAPDWAGNVGVITTLIPGVDIEPDRTVAVVVGPPVMYHFVVKELLAKHIPENRIMMSFERHMKCGVGKCGRCQFQHLYCCKDGPVFFYDRIKNLSEAL